MKKIIFSLISLTLLFSFISCGSTKVEDSNGGGTVTYRDEPKKKTKVEKVVVNEEYIRSTQTITTEESVSIEEFEKDKAEILKIIDELKVIMENGDRALWLTYIDPESKLYYSNATNLRKVREKLPNKQIQLHGIGDYFKYVFIPSRKNSKIDEIRYIAKNNIRAVQVREDGSELVYYYFIKKADKWYVRIPKLDEQ